MAQRPHVLECAKEDERTSFLCSRSPTLPMGPNNYIRVLTQRSGLEILEHKDPLIKLHWCTMDSSEMLGMNSKKDPEGNLTLHSNTLCSFGRRGRQCIPLSSFLICVFEG